MLDVLPSPAPLSWLCAHGREQAGVPYITSVPQVCRYSLASGVTPVVLVLASDGVWETLSNAEVVAAAVNAKSAEGIEQAIHNQGTRSSSGAESGALDVVPLPDNKGSGSSSTSPPPVHPASRSLGSRFLCCLLFHVLCLSAPREPPPLSPADWQTKVQRAERFPGEYLGTASDRVIGLTLVKVLLLPRLRLFLLIVEG